MTEMPQKEVPPPLELVKERIEEVLPPDAREEIENGDVVVVDVRDAERFEQGHIEGAVSAPSGSEGKGSHADDYAREVEDAVGDRSRRVLLYCGEGTRSARTADALRNEHGFENVASIIGGASLWGDLGFPVDGQIAPVEKSGDGTGADMGEQEGEG
jgi:rhodanese-related sulfurtransferase